MNRFLSLLLIAVLFVGVAYAQTPPTPTELRVMPMPNAHVGAWLTWRAPQGTQQYRVYRSANDSLHFSAIGTSMMMSYGDTAILRGTRYYYYVKSFIGTIESERSNIASFLLEVLPPLPTPTDLTARLQVFMFEPSVKLNWRAPRGPWAYRIYRSTNDTVHYRLLAYPRDTMFTDFGVRAESTYYYYVRSASLLDTAVSPRSNVASIRVTAPRRPLGTIRGTVIDDSTSLPISRAMVRFYRSNACWRTDFSAVTDSLGRYSALLDTGRYIMKTDGPMVPFPTPRYRSEWYDNVTEPQHATVIALRDSQVFVANVGLSRMTPPSYANLSGTVRDTLGNPVRSASVSIMRTQQEMNFLAATLGVEPGTGEESMHIDGIGYCRGVVWTGRTDSLGRYTARLMANKSYIAMATKQGYVPEYYNHKRTIQEADIIQLTTRDTSGIDFTLRVRVIVQGSISGIVRDSLGTRVPSRIMLFPVFREPASRVFYGHTDSLGAYTIGQVTAGRYFVMAQPYSNYAPAFYKEGAYGVMRWQDADTVNIAGAVTGINIGVKRISGNGVVHIGGTVRALNGTLLEGVNLIALSSDGVVGWGVTDNRGNYDIDGVPTGVVNVVVDRNGWTATQATVNIGASTFTVDGVDFTMTPATLTSAPVSPSLPAAYALGQNYPNPFNPSTKVSFELPVASNVTVQIFNLLGQEIVSLLRGDFAAGAHAAVWNGRDAEGRTVASGVYLYKLKAVPSAGGAEFSAIRKMVLLK